MKKILGLEWDQPRYWVMVKLFILILILTYLGYTFKKDFDVNIRHHRIAVLWIGYVVLLSVIESFRKMRK